MQGCCGRSFFGGIVRAGEGQLFNLRAFLEFLEFAVIAAFGVVLTAGYILWTIQRVYLGKEKDEYKGYPDASAREVFVLTPMAVLAIALGVLPKQTLFNFMNDTLDRMIEHIGEAAHLFASVM